MYTDTDIYIYNHNNQITIFLYPRLQGYKWGKFKIIRKTYCIYTWSKKRGDLVMDFRFTIKQYCLKKKTGKNVDIYGL